MRVLDRRGLLDGLSIQAERELRALGRRRDFAPGQLLPSALFTADGKYAVLIEQGLVKLAASSAERETLLWVRGPGDLLGEHAALRDLSSGQHRPASRDFFCNWDRSRRRSTPRRPPPTSATTS